MYHWASNVEDPSPPTHHDCRFIWLNAVQNWSPRQLHRSASLLRHYRSRVRTRLFRRMASGTIIVKSLPEEEPKPKTTNTLPMIPLAGSAIFRKETSTTPISDTSSESALMRFAKEFGYFVLGATMTFMLPAIGGLMITALIFAFDRDIRAFTGSGPLCVQHDEMHAASPNGRWIAVATRLDCEEASNPRQNETRIFIMSSRLDRAGEIAVLEKSPHQPLSLTWQGNQGLDITTTPGTTLSFESKWCGITPSISR